MTRLELLDSAQHKLRLAAYHASALRESLGRHPSEGLEDRERIAMEAHLEGLAYTGTSAAEKTLRSIDPEAMQEQMPIQRMLVIVKDDARPAAERDFGRAFEQWWFDVDQVAWVARELRNDASHRVYEKAPDGALWRMEIAGRAIGVGDFADSYGAQLRELSGLVDQATELAAVGPH